MGLEWSLELTPSKSFFCMKMLRWSFAYSVMVSDNSHLNWSSWFTTRNRLVSGVEDLVLRRSLDFLKLCSFFLFLLRCSSLLLKPDEEESREEVELIPLLYFFSCVIFSPNIYISFSNAFAPWAIFWKIYIVICIICDLISIQIWEKIFYKDSPKFDSSFLFTCE